MKSPQSLTGLFRSAALVCIAALMVFPAKADLIELTNGDHYRGNVIGMTQTTLEFQSEIQGRVKLPREKVARITLREPVSQPTAVTPQAIPSTPETRNHKPETSTLSQADEVTKQMREQGIDPRIVKQVQEQIFGKASPEAAQKFNDTMEGLMSGRVSVQDIRAQALDSIKQIKAARAELGDEAGGMLDGYLAVLEKFVQETGPGGSATVPRPAAPNPPAAPPAAPPATTK
jgi:hypothetical protein